MERLNVENYTILIQLSIIIVKNHMKEYFQRILYITRNYFKGLPKIEGDQELKKLMLRIQHKFNP